METTLAPVRGKTEVHSACGEAFVACPDGRDSGGSGAVRRGCDRVADDVDAAATAVLPAAHKLFFGPVAGCAIPLASISRRAVVGRERIVRAGGRRRRAMAVATPDDRTAGDCLNDRVGRADHSLSTRSRPVMRRLCEWRQNRKRCSAS